MKTQNGSTLASDLSSLLSILRTRRTKVFLYGFAFAFVACTAFIAFSPSGSASPWAHNIFTSAASFKASMAPYKDHLSNFISRIFPNGTSSAGTGGGSGKGGFLGTWSAGNGAPVDGSRESGVGSPKGGILGGHGAPAGSSPKRQVGPPKDAILGTGSAGNGAPVTASPKRGVGSAKDAVLGGKNQSSSGIGSGGGGVPGKDQKGSEVQKDGNLAGKKNQTGSTVPAKNQAGSAVSAKNQTAAGAPAAAKRSSDPPAAAATKLTNVTASLKKGNVSASPESNASGRKGDEWIKSMIGCDIFRGRWVKDDSYPLYPEGSCPHIDEPFDCYLNGRPDRSYQKLRWQPDGCNIPRLNATDMLERLRGKRLVFVGDSLNRNMWESLVCVLRNSVKDKMKVFEASGKHEFRTEGSYSFLFKDYGCTVEFFRSPFLVQEWEMPDGEGKKKETLRLDIIERSSSRYKDAHVIVFNTGHWWTHEKTSKGKDYYQEGDRIYGELNVVEAFHKALNTWAKWVDANINPKKSLVFFRGYSASHFRGGQWNSGGACDKENEPIKNEKYLSSYPPKMSVLESVIKGMKTPVSYLNITRMTDYRKDAHPSVYRKQNLTEEERKDPLRFQDCSHWCLPGVPDSWNELLYAQLLVKQYQMTH